VNFGPVTPEKTGLICELFVYDKQKTGVFSRISQDILDRFLQSFHHISALGADDRPLPRFRYVKGRCHGNQKIDFGKMS